MAGLNEGLLTMRPGGKRIMVLPPKLAYSYMGIKDDRQGKEGTDIIPPYS